jgi:hypothetical protein
MMFQKLGIRGSRTKPGEILLKSWIFVPKDNRIGIVYRTIEINIT